MKTKRGHFIPLPEGFNVLVPSEYAQKFSMRPTGIYVTWGRNRAWLHYAGEHASQACIDFEIPASPKYLRALSKSISELADKIASEKG